MTISPPAPDALRAPQSDSFAELPIHLTRFIGRGAEPTELARLLSGTRLLTLTGAGSGKTRLALELAAHGVGDYARIGWTELATLTDRHSLLRKLQARSIFPIASA
jgi:hypothetical protein